MIFLWGKDYPKPVVDLQTAARHASKQLWSIKGSVKVRKESKRILLKHTLADRNKFD